MKGTLYYVPNVDLALSSINEVTKVISLDESPQYDNINGVIKASCLLPPPSAMIAEVDGKADEFYGIYKAYLASDTTSEFINTIICYLLSGGNIIILIPPELQSSQFIQVLFQHMFDSYGIKVGTEADPFWYNNQYDVTNFNIAYTMGVMDGYTYLSVYPVPLTQLDQYSLSFVLEKLYEEFRPMQNPNPQDLIRYFEDMRIKLHTNPNIKQGIVFDF